MSGSAKESAGAEAATSVECAKRDVICESVQSTAFFYIKGLGIVLAKNYMNDNVHYLSDLFVLILVADILQSIIATMLPFR